MCKYLIILIFYLFFFFKFMLDVGKAGDDAEAAMNHDEVRLCLIILLSYHLGPLQM